MGFILALTAASGIREFHVHQVMVSNMPTINWCLLYFHRAGLLNEEEHHESKVIPEALRDYTWLQ